MVIEVLNCPEMWNFPPFSGMRYIHRIPVTVREPATWWLSIPTRMPRDVTKLR